MPEETDTCPTPSGSGTEITAFVKTDTTWTAEGSPYLLDFDLGVDAGATLTLEPCTVVKLPKGRNVNVSGLLVAKGESGRRVRIEPLVEGEPWGMITSSNQDTLSLDLAYTTVRGGGTAADPRTAMLSVRGAPNDVPNAELIRVQHVRLEDSASAGALVYEGAAFTSDSTDLTITGSGFHPLTMDSHGLSSLPTGSYTGNALDVIDLSTWKASLAGKPGETLAVTMHERGVPYRIGSDQEGAVELAVGSSIDSALTTLTIEPGVTVRVREKGVLRIRGPKDDQPASGSLVAKGTEAAPIVFTSDAKSPAAGDWIGIWLEAGVPTGMAIENARVEYAGAEWTVRGFSCGTPVASDQDLISNRGAIVVKSGLDVTASFVRSTAIVASASNGIDRAWSGSATDFTTSNTFENVAFCTQTENKSPEGTCPTEPSCPRAP